ncbi:hypothetical protein CDL15_Pgr021691 [Punica granatum]|uniref:Uncharacterized protein n=1 Tax=Punica granatum TaxID=22663 RepID=A0A218WRP3_PUNGR|nr:hypothetical protein CDL15_Pgr021691 [Punica granatum]
MESVAAAQSLRNEGGRGMVVGHQTSSSYKRGKAEDRTSRAELCLSPPRLDQRRWDADTNTITVDPDVWDMFIKKNMAYKTLWSKGSKHYDLDCLVLQWLPVLFAYPQLIHLQL